MPSELTTPTHTLPNVTRKTRLKDVAKLAGVSVATVSHVVNKNYFVSDGTKHKVEMAVKTLGYTPNIDARNLARKHRHKS